MSFVTCQLTQTILPRLECHQVILRQCAYVKLITLIVSKFKIVSSLISTSESIYLRHQPKFFCCFLNSFTNWRKHLKKKVIMFPYSCFRHINVISSAMSCIDHLNVDKSEDRLQWSSMYLSIKLIHNFHGNQKPFLVSAVQNISWQFSGSFSAIYFQINTQLLRGRFTPLPIFKMKLWTRAITLSQGKPLSINSWCYQKAIQTLY